MGKENNEDFDESIAQLTDLLKAEDVDDSDALLKANGSEDDDKSDDEYDEKYMKRHMKRFLKNNKSTAMKYMKEMGSVKKAIDHDMDEINGELGDAEAVLVNGTDILKAAQEQSDNFVGVLHAIIPEQVQQGKLIKALGSVVLEMAEQINLIGSVPQPRKGVTNGGETDLTKAKDTDEGGEEAPVGSLQKAVSFMKENGFGGIRKKVLKAMNNGDQKAFETITRLEACNGNLALLPKTTQDYIADLVSAEG